MDKKIITLVFLLTVFVAGLSIVEPINAGFFEKYTVDKCSFKVKGEKITIDAWNYGKGSPYILIDITGKGVPKKYKYLSLEKEKKIITSYSFSKTNNKNTVMNSYKTSKTVDKFYKNTYKKYLITTLKKNMNKK